jgi:hypothetical protein
MGLLKAINKERFIEAMGFASTTPVRNIEVHIKPMLEKHIRDMIGQPIIDYLNEEFEDIILDEDSSDYELLTRFELTLYSFVAEKMADRNAVQHTASGITTQKTDNSVSATNQLIHNLKKNYLESAYDALEELLKYLNDNADIFPEYADSEAFEKNKSFFIPDAKTFDENYKLLKRNQTYLHLRSAMKDAEELIIEASIGTPYYLDLKEKMQAGSTTAPDDAAIRLIQKVVAFYTIHDACKQDWVTYTPEGVVFTEWVGSVTDGSTKITVAQAEQISLKISHAKESGELYLNRLMERLNSNPELYPIYTTWKEEQNPQPEQPCDEFSKKLGCKDKNSGIFW